VSDLQRGADRIQDLTAQLAAERAARQAEREAMERLTESQHRYVALVALRDQQIAALREGLVQAETALLAYRFPAGENAEQLSRRAGDAITKARALLATPAAEPDDEIRMPIHPGIPGVGVVVSAGPRPELVIERDVSSIDCERCGRYIELDEHEGDLCNDCRATMTAGEEAT